MSLQRIFRYRSPDELATSMAGRLVQRIIDLQATRDCVNLALTSGNTASSMSKHGVYFRPYRTDAQPGS